MALTRDYIDSLFGGTTESDYVYGRNGNFLDVPENKDDQGFFGFLADNLKAGTGAFMETGANWALDHMDPDAAANSSDLQWIRDTGRQLKEDNTNYYTPGSAKYYGASLIQSLPEMGADMAASMGAGAVAGSALGPAAASVGAGIRGGANALKWGRRALDFYNGSSKLARAARWATPTFSSLPSIAASTGTGMWLESNFEGQRAMDEYIEDAKRNGTYIEGVTENEARGLRDRVTRDNMKLLSGTNLAENALIFGKGKGFFNGLKRLGKAMAVEGFEEGAQQIIPKYERGEDWHVTDRDVLEAAALGAMGGGMMHLGGRGIKAVTPDAWWGGADVANGGINVNSDGHIDPITDPTRDAERDNDVPLPTDIDYTSADPEDIMDKYLKDEAKNDEGPKMPKGSNPKDNTPSAPLSNGAGEGQTWKKQTDSVSYEGATPETMSAIDALGKWFYDKTGKQLVITSVTDGSSHQGGERGHKAGQKFDCNDFGSGAEGTLLGEDGGKGTLTDEFIKYGQSLGLGMNWEGDHIDVSTLGDQWDGSTDTTNFGGFHGGKNQSINDDTMSPGPNTSDKSNYDGNFTDKQNEAWQEAQWVEQQTGIPAEYVYRQWAHESANFESQLARENNNLGGLTQSEPNGEENKQPDGGNYYRKYNNLHEYAESYVRDFINKYDGKENVKSMEDFVNFLHNNGYFTADPQEYLAAMEKFDTPTTRGFSKTFGKSMIKFAGDDDDMVTNTYQKIMDSLENKTELPFANMYDENGKFKNTAANRMELAGNETTANLIQMAAEQIAPSMIAKVVGRNGKLTKADIKEFMTPHTAGINLVHLKQLMANDGLTAPQKEAVLQEAANQIQIPRLNLPEEGQMKFANDLQKAIDTRDFKRLYYMMPRESARAIANLANQPTPQSNMASAPTEADGLVPSDAQTAALAGAVGLPQQEAVAQSAPSQQMPPAPTATISNLETVHSAEQYNPDMPPRTAGTPQTGAMPQGLPPVPTEQENVQTAAKIANKARQIANTQTIAAPLGGAKEFKPRVSELSKMPKEQLTQTGTQTLAIMNDAGMPVSKELKKGLTEGDPRAIAHAEGKMQKREVKAKKAAESLQKKVDAIIARYRDGKLSYEDAMAKIADEAQTMAQKNPEAMDSLQGIFYNAIDTLNGIYAKNTAQTSQERAGEADSTAQDKTPAQETKAAQNGKEPAKSFDKRVAELEKMPLKKRKAAGSNVAHFASEYGYSIKNKKLLADVEAGIPEAIAKVEKMDREIRQNHRAALAPQEAKATEWVEKFKNGECSYPEAEKAIDKISYENRSGVGAWDCRNLRNDMIEKLNAVYYEKHPWPLEDKGPISRKEHSPQERLNYLSNKQSDDVNAEVERMKRNPGGKGVNTVYTKNDRGEINGRMTESLNPLWYQKAYKELGRKPKKSEYPEIAYNNLKEHEEFAKRAEEIERLENEMRADGSLPEWLMTPEEYDEHVKNLTASVERAEGKTEAAKKKSKKGATPSNEETAKESAKNEPSKQEATTEESTAVPEQENPFGNVDDNFADLANALGISPAKQEPVKKTANTSSKKKAKKRNMGMSDTSKEREEELKKQLSEALKKSRNRLNAMPFFDPDVIVPAFNLGRLYIQRGAQNFAEYARDMIDAVGDSVRSWLHPVWEMCENYPEGKSFDESQIIPMFRYVGSYMNDHQQATLDEVKADFAKRAGKDNADKFSDLLELGYHGAYNFYNNNTEVTDDELNGSTGENLERNSEGNHQDEVGPVHGNGESDSRGGQGVQSAGKDSRAQRSGSVHGRSTARSGETGDSGVQGNESGNESRSDSTGDKHLAGSRRDSFDRPAIDDGRNAESLRPAENRPDNGGNHRNETEAVKQDKDSITASDRAEIAKSMPFLMDGQVDDVIKAEKRLYKSNGEGMMFTNGTGTGKTFTGLGIIKRSVQRGKGNILIVAPTDKVQNDWITAGKGFFDLTITKLENTADAGKGIVITSYENVGANNKLVSRDWDMIVTDESHKLMQGEKGNRTHALENIRAMTYHHGGLRERFERLRAKEYEHLRELFSKSQKHGLTADESKEYNDLNAKLIKESEKAIAEWKQIPQESKPKVVFLSATPFSYVPDIDYAEGYLFNYDYSKDNNGGYNQPNAYDDFIIKHFGYRMRVGKLTKPDADVNNDLMEINFNKWLKDQGVLSGRKLSVNPDYERGYILVDSGVGKQIDEGMKIATERSVSPDKEKYGKLHGIFENKLKGNKTRYLLEAIKAKEAVGLINDYVKGGKKVVVFHDFKKNEAENPFVLTDDDFEGLDEVDKSTAHQQYSRFCKEHPELLNLNLDDLQSPIDRLTEAFGDAIRIFNGSVPKKKREQAVQEFNDDDSKVKVILCQRASAKEGISMHDTTGKYQRVMIDLGLATRPTDLIQGEGRIYRTGVKSNAIIRYLNTGTDMEKRAFASTIAGRASTAENLSMGEEARALRDAIVEGFMESLDSTAWKKYLPNSKTEGKGGKERDSKLMDGVSPYEAAKSDYFANQKKTSRNKAQEGIDYFPTPEPVGFKMVEWLGLKAGDRALEPSAGHGAISRYFPAETRNTIVEPSAELATLAKMRLAGGTTAKVVEGTFENLDIHNKYEGIAMNPPYGLGGKTAYDHVAKAFNHLADGGRLIAIVPDGPAANKRLEKWLFGDGTKENPGQNNAALLAEIKLPQVTFNRAGTSVATKILVIDKYADADDMAKAMANAKGTIDFTSVKDINELFDRIENMTFSERVGSDIPRRFVNSTNNRSQWSRYITLPDDAQLVNDSELRTMAREFNGGPNRKGGWFEFSREGDRAKFVRAANRYLAGRDAATTERQEIVEETETPKTEHFEAGDFEHTKTGKMIPQAKIKDKVDEKTYKALSSLARHNGGYYSRYAKTFLFDDNVAGRNKFLEEAEAFLSAKGSYSTAAGKTLTTDELNALWDKTANVVEEESLTPREKELSAMAETMGANLKFVTCDPRIQGKYDPRTGVSYINRDAVKNSTPWITWHELFHWMKRNNEPLFDKMVEHIKGKAAFTKNQLDNYRAAIGRPDMDDATTIEEMMADAFPEVRQRVPFFRDLAKENTSLYKRLVAFVKRVMDDIVSRFNASYTKGNGLTVKQANIMRDKFCDMVRDLRDGNGNYIFKVKDGVITDRDGRTTDQLAAAYSAAKDELSKKNDVDNVEQLGDNEFRVDNRDYLHESDYQNRALDSIEQAISGLSFSHQTDTVDSLFDKVTSKEVATTNSRLAYRKKAKNLQQKNAITIIAAREINAIRAKREVFYHEETLSRLYEFIQGRFHRNGNSPLAESIKARLDETLGQRRRDVARGNVAADGGRFVGNRTVLNAHTGGKAHKSDDWEAAETVARQIWNDEVKNRPSGEPLVTFKNYANKKHSDEQGAFSVAPNEPAGSPNRIRTAIGKLLGLQEKLDANVKDMHTKRLNDRTSLDGTLPKLHFMHSTKYLAGKNEAIKRMYYLGKRCSDEQEHLRNEFNEAVKKIHKLVSDPKDKESLQALLWAGDASSEEYTSEQLKAEGFSDNVISAYRLVRDNLAKAYQLVNEARMQVKARNKTIKASELPTFMKENFITDADIINTQKVGDGKIVVTYRGPKVYSNLTIDGNEDLVKQFEADSNIVVTDKTEVGDGIYHLTYNEIPKPLGKLKGYMPHFFHRFMVYANVKDDAGNNQRVAIGSAESLVEATKLANKAAKANPDTEFVIDTHSFEYGDENNNVVIGDKDYQEMTKRIAESTEMSLQEANKFLHDEAGATLKSRHRFFGNMMKRTGVQGFDENMSWALTHYFNSAARYVAMEHFKPEAISWYERFFGDFNADPKLIKSVNKRRTAQIIRDYINDVNGNPRGIEQWCNKVADNIPIFGKKLNDSYNGRPALAISSAVSWFNAVTKLGCLNVASPMLNFMQYINIVTMLNSVKYAKIGLMKAMKPSELDKVILDRSGIMDEINLSSDAGGYTQYRDNGGVKKGFGKGKQMLDKSMFFFTWCDAIMRKAAILGAYHQAVNEKNMKPDVGQQISAAALDYAKEVNAESNFDYSAANTPEAIRFGSVLTQQLFQFQKYPIMQFEFFWNHVVHGTNGQRARFLLPYFLLTGLPGMVPFGELMAGFLNALLSLLPGDDDDFTKRMKAELMRWAGDDKAKQAIVNSLTNGPLAAFTGIDISERAGMQNFFAGRYYGDKPSSTPEALAQLLGGAAVSTATSVRKQLENGNPVEAIKAISPGLGNWIQAALGESRTTHHRISSTYEGIYERLLHGMGFRHIDETNAQFINSYLYEEKQRQRESKKYVMDAYLENPSEENKQELKAFGVKDKELKKYKESKGISSLDRAVGNDKKKSSKKPKTEAQANEDALRKFMK